MGKPDNLTIDRSDSPDLTPMVDVIFLLIIFFLIAGRLIQAGRPDIDVPIAANAKVSAQSVFRTEFTVTNQGHLFHNDTPIGSVGDPAKMTRIIREKQSQAGGEELQVYLRVDAEATYHDVRKVMDACAEASQKNIQFATYRTES